MFLLQQKCNLNTAFYLHDLLLYAISCVPTHCITWTHPIIMKRHPSTTNVSTQSAPRVTFSSLHWKWPIPPSTLSYNSISKQNLFHAMSFLDPPKVVGIDGIGPKGPKTLCSGPLQTTLSSFSDKPFTILSSSRLVEFKSGDKSSVHSYRPS